VGEQRELEQQQLLVGQPAAGGLHVGRAPRTVPRRERVAPQRQPALHPQGRRDGIGDALHRARQRLLGQAAQDAGRDAGGRVVDRHQAADRPDLAAGGLLRGGDELVRADGQLQARRAAARVAAGQDDRAGLQRPHEERLVEPHEAGARAVAVLDVRDDDAQVPPPGAALANAQDAAEDGGELALLDLRQPAHVGQVLVAERQRLQHVADGLQPELRQRPAEPRRDVERLQEASRVGGRAGTRKGRLERGGERRRRHRARAVGVATVRSASSRLASRRAPLAVRSPRTSIARMRRTSTPENSESGTRTEPSGAKPVTASGIAKLPIG
jgi:hypothetical protein